MYHTNFYKSILFICSEGKKNMFVVKNVKMSLKKIPSRRQLSWDIKNLGIEIKNT